MSTGPGMHQAPRSAFSQNQIAILLLLPIMLVNAAAFMVPIFNLAWMSFKEALPGGGIGEAFTLANWGGLLTDMFYLEIIWVSVWVSLGITLATLILSYPIAFYLHRSTGTRKTILIVLVISPLLTSAVVRTYGWIALLANDGPVVRTIAALGFPAPQLMFNINGIFIGLTEILMPYMILALLAGFGRLEDQIEEAARTLGAPPIKVFWRIILPLTAPGIALGCLLCFVLAVSSFITPKLMGGGRVFLLATEIYDQAIVTLNWPRAATLSVLVLLIFGAALWFYSILMRRVV